MPSMVASRWQNVPTHREERVTAAALPAQPSPFAVLRKKAFVYLWSAQLVSTIGDSLTSLAAGIIVYRVTGSVLNVGLMLMAAACFDPREAIPLWERMAQASGGAAQPEFSSTHPNPGTRIQNLEALMPKAMEYRAKFCTQSGTTAGAR